MNVPPARTLSESAQLMCLFFILLVPFSAAGLALINCGLGRARNAAHMMLSSLLVFSVAALAFLVFGFSWQGYAGRAAHIFTIGAKPWDLIAAEPFFFRGLAWDGSPASLAALLGMMSAGLAAIIPLGSGADRWRLGAASASTIVFAGGIYPLFAHWAWGGGWLSQLGVNYSLGQGLVDAGGALPINAVGGAAALAITWILQPRRGKYTADRMPLAIPGHSGVFVLLGCFFAWFGWIALCSAGSILYSNGDLQRTVLIAVNVTAGAASAMLCAAGITRARFGKTDASLCANGWVGGLVASSAGCAVIPPAGAIIVGLVAGALVIFSVEWLELHLTIDDPGGSIPVHLLSGIWGALSVGWFARFPSGANTAGQWIAQLAGITSVLGFVLPLTYLLNWLLGRLYPMRVTPDGERQGLDLHELGAGAYPDFITHKDDYLQR